MDERRPSAHEQTAPIPQEPIGFIGVGAIAEAIIEGLSSTERPPAMFLSPRSAELASGLASRHANVTVCADNQAVAEAARTLFLTVRTDTVDEVLSELTVPADRVVISAVAGRSIRALREHLGQGPDVVRTIPLPAVRELRGVTALFPGHPEATRLFDRLGGSITAPTEDAFSALSATTAAISSYFHFLTTVSGWLAREGYDRSEAELFVRSVFRGTTVSLADTEKSLDELRGAHETPGGINATLRTEWFDERNTRSLERALDGILRFVSTD